MKTVKSLLGISTSLFLLLFFNSCEDSIKHEYSVNSPIYMSKADFKSAVTSESARGFSETGKIYFYNNYILVNEKLKGIHVIDNNDPSNPQTVSFINIPGNIDMAVKNNILYADSYTDLLAINISDFNNISVQKRFEKVFPYFLPPTNNNLRYGEIDEDKGVVIGWEVKRISEDVENPKPYPCYYDTALFNGLAESSAKGNVGEAGKAGSMARFMIYQNTLYTLNNRASLNIYDISNPDQLTQNGNINVQWDIETIFAQGNSLFFGARNGTYIYDITNPFVPEALSEYRHFTGCDPVVVDGNYAYITLRAGNNCGQATSQLDVVDITDLSNPTRLVSHSMVNPYGLGKDGDLLFICDGTAGLKIFDATDPLSIGSNLIKTYSNFTPFDVIPLGNVLVAISPEGLYQYDYSDINNIQLLSSIEIFRED